MNDAATFHPFCFDRCADFDPAEEAYAAVMSAGDVALDITAAIAEPTKRFRGSFVLTPKTTPMGERWASLRFVPNAQAMSWEEDEALFSARCALERAGFEVNSGTGREKWTLYVTRPEASQRAA